MNATAPQVPNNLVWAILATLFCCLPAGIVSIVYAAQVNNKLAAGDVAGAQESSEKAKKWAIYSVIAFVALVVVYAILFVVLGIGGAASSGY